MNVITLNTVVKELSLSRMIGGFRSKHKKVMFVPRREPGESRIDKENPMAFGPLTNLPDYTFMDGRPTPLMTNQKNRLMYQRQIASQIVSLSKEVDFAKDRFARIQKEKAESRQTILNSKLKEKGLLLLKK